MSRRMGRRGRWRYGFDERQGGYCAVLTDVIDEEHRCIPVVLGLCVGEADIVFPSVEIGAQGTDDRGRRCDEDQPDEQHQQDQDAQLDTKASSGKPDRRLTDEAPHSA